MTGMLKRDRQGSYAPPLAVQCSFTEHRNMKVVYRRYASLFFLVGIDAEEVSAIFSIMYD